MAVLSGLVTPRARPAVGEASPAAAVASVVIAWSLAAGAVALWAVNRPPLGVDTWFFAVDVTVAVVYGGVGALILARRRHPVAWIFVLAAVGGGAAAFGWQYGLRAGEIGGLPADGFVGSMVGWAWVPGTLALVTVVPWMVREPAPGCRGWLGGAGRAVALAVVAGWVVSVGTTVVRLTDPAPWPDAEPRMPLAVRSTWWLSTIEMVLQVAFALVVGLGLLAAVDVARRWRSTAGRAAGLGWLLLGTVAMALSFVPLVLPTTWVDGNVTVPTLTPVLHLVSQAFLPAATVVVVLRQRLWGLDLALNRTLVRALLSAALIGVYVVVVLIADQLFAGTGASAALGAAAIAALVLPLRTWLQRRVDRLVLGAAAEPDEAIRGMSRVLGDPDVAPATGLVDSVATHLASSFRLASVTVAAYVGDERRELATVGHVDGPEHHVPLARGADVVGRLSVSARFGERLDARSLAAIADLAPMVAATVSLAVLNDELARTGARLTEARLEERRILRRDLHDGLGPALAGIGLGLQAYRNLRTTDPAGADALLDRLCAEVDQRVQDVRHLSRQLLPPAVEELGLGAALRELAGRFEAGGTTVRVDVPELVELEPPVVHAAYAIASEALVNAQRHGRARTVGITVRHDDDLVLEIANDGAPIDPGAPSGIGLRSMRERVRELGGSIRIGTDDRGATVVRATLPVGGVA